jgi:hypothetical protein
MLEAALRLWKPAKSTAAAAAAAEIEAAAAAAAAEIEVSAAAERSRYLTLVKGVMLAATYAGNVYNSTSPQPSLPTSALSTSLMRHAELMVWDACKSPADGNSATTAASSGNEAAAAAAAEAATQAALAAARQSRQQVQLRLASLLCSCVKALAREQQHCSWQAVAVLGCDMAKLSSQLATLEATVQDACTQDAVDMALELQQDWCKVYKGRQMIPNSLVQMLQHAYGKQLVTNLNPVAMKLASDYSRQLQGEKLPAQMEPQQLNADICELAAMLAHLASMQDSTSDRARSSDATASCSSSSRSSGTTSEYIQLQGDSSSSSSCVLSSTELDVQLACVAVVARAARLYGTVLQHAFSNACLDKAATAAARAAGAVQLQQQMHLARTDGLLEPLPYEVQQQLDSGDESGLSTSDGAAAVIAACLGDQGQQIESIAAGIGWFAGVWAQLGRSLQVPQDMLQQLTELTECLQENLGYALGRWHVHTIMQATLACEAASDDGDGSCDWDAGVVRIEEAAARTSSSDNRTAKQRAAWVAEATGIGGAGTLLVAALQRWADAVCAALPSRRCCSNPCCVMLREMSESNMVNGKACCCGGCAAAGQAVRYCGRDCQASHWLQHKALCRSKQQQQQGQGQKQ